MLFPCTDEVALRAPSHGAHAFLQWLVFTVWRLSMSPGLRAEKVRVLAQVPALAPVPVPAPAFHSAPQDSARKPLHHVRFPAASRARVACASHVWLHHTAGHGFAPFGGGHHFHVQGGFASVFPSLFSLQFVRPVLPFNCPTVRCTALVRSRACVCVCVCACRRHCLALLSASHCC